jgi:hypothetical protein
MDQPILIDTTTETETPEAITPQDITAMVAMLDYLIDRACPIDEMAAHCLMLARDSLSAIANGPAQAN